MGDQSDDADEIEPDDSWMDDEDEDDLDDEDEDQDFEWEDVGDD